MWRRASRPAKEIEPTRSPSFSFGGPAWIRTRNQQITSHQLKTNDFSDFPLAFVVTSKQIWSQLLPQMLPKLPASHANARPLPPPDSVEPRLRVGSAPVSSLCNQSGGHVLVEVHPLSALLGRPKLRVPYHYSEQKANLLNSYSEPHGNVS